MSAHGRHRDRPLVLDADLLEAVLSNPDPKKAKEAEIKVARRLSNSPKALPATRLR